LVSLLAPQSLEARLRAGVAAVPITPFGPNSDWKGPISASGVWGDQKNRIWLAGFGNNRPAEGKHDELWARALVLDSDGTRVALVTLDLIGYFQNAGSYGVDRALALVQPGVKFDAVIVASTHNHEGPDTIGLWGAAAGQDGKYRDYLQFVDRQIARALNEAGDPKRMIEVKAVFGSRRSAALRNLQVRTQYRPPIFFDDELRAAAFITPGNSRQKSKVVATLVNWNAHPESMGSANRLITSDFPHYVREAIEKQTGGVALYFSGDLGASEITGDAPVRGSDFETIGERKFPLDPKTRKPPVTFERTQAIGELIADEALQALETGDEDPVKSIKVHALKITVPVTNPTYQALQKAGVLFGGETLTTTLYHVSLGAAELITLPGEVFPELVYGVETFHRTDCPAAATGRPYEPAILPLLRASYKFILGMAPDELGYVVPQYDFVPLPPQPWPADGRQAPDACASNGIPAHYHETNSVSYEMAPTLTCAYLQLLGGDLAAHKACEAYLKTIIGP
jgi:hypothetical protein